MQKNKKHKNWVRDPTMFIKQSVLCLGHKSKQLLLRSFKTKKHDKHLQTSVHQRGKSYTLMSVTTREPTCTVRFKTKHQPPTCSMITSQQCNHKVAVDWNSNPSPHVSGALRMEAERLPTSCGDGELKNKTRQ